MKNLGSPIQPVAVVVVDIFEEVPSRPHLVLPPQLFHLVALTHHRASPPMREHLFPPKRCCLAFLLGDGIGTVVD